MMSNAIPHFLVMAQVYKHVELETCILTPFTRNRCGEPLEKKTREVCDMCLCHLSASQRIFNQIFLHFNLQRVGNL